MFFWHHIPLGVDFRGGTLVYVRFVQAPNEDSLRKTLDGVGLGNARIQRYGPAGDYQELIDLPQRSDATDVSADKNQIIQALGSNTPAGKQDLNNVGVDSVRSSLAARDPLHASGQEYDNIARQILDYRDKQRHGLLGAIDELKS